MTLYSASLRAQRSSLVERGLFASAFDDRDHLDLDHSLGLREAADLDRRAGWKFFRVLKDLGALLFGAAMSREK